MTQNSHFKYIAYYRRSKKVQESTLGLQAQKEDVERYVASKQGELVAEYTELESGTPRRRTFRYVIQQALEHARKEDCILVIAKLDRLARDVEFTASLYNAGVRFVCCDNPEANELTIKMLAVVAENEAQNIRKKTKEGLAQAVKEGKILGCMNHKKPGCKITPEARMQGMEVRIARARLNNNNRKGAAYAYSLHKQGLTLVDIVKEMREHGYTSARGGELYPMTVSRWIQSRENAVKMQSAPDVGADML